MQQKGGPDKTTLACLLASGAISMGLRVHCVDGDRNPQLANWQSRFNHYKWEISQPDWPANLSTSSLTGKVDDFYKELEKLEKDGVDLVILDTRPGSNEDTEDFAYAADVILIPAKPVPAEYELSIKTYEWILALRKSFPDLPSFPEIKLVLSDASPAVIQAMSPNGDMDKLTKTEIGILTRLINFPFCLVAIPNSQICKQLPFIGPLGSAAIAYSKSPGGKLRERSINRLLEVGKHLVTEVRAMGRIDNA